MGMTILRRALALQPSQGVFIPAAASRHSTPQVTIEPFPADADVLCVGVEPFVWHAIERWEISAKDGQVVCAIGAGHQPTPELLALLSGFRSSVLRVRGAEGINAMKAFKTAHQALIECLRRIKKPSILPVWYFAELSFMGPAPSELEVWESTLMANFGPSTKDVEHYSVWATVPPAEE